MHHKGAFSVLDFFMIKLFAKAIRTSKECQPRGLIRRGRSFVQAEVRR